MANSKLKPLALTFDDICDELDYSYDNEVDFSIYAYGKDLHDILDYIECEYGIKDASTEKLETLADNEIYSLDIYLNDAFEYYLSQAYFNGNLLEDDNRGQITFISNEAKFRDDDAEKRIYGTKFFFDLVEEDFKDSDKGCACCYCEYCNK